MGKLGTLTLQALDRADVFLSEDVFLAGVKNSDEIICEIPEPGFEDDKAWVTGNVPSTIPVSVDGDTSVVYGWYKGETVPYPYQVRIYIVYEEVEEE